MNKTLTPRELTATGAFQEAWRQLQHVVFPTPQLELVVADIKRLHREVAHRVDKDQDWGPNNRMTARQLIILGDYGSSKSFAVQYALASLEPLDVGLNEPVQPKTLYREAPNGEARAWQRDLLGQMGYSMARMPSSEAAMAQIESRIRQVRPTMLVCDELSRVLNPRNYGSQAKLAAQAEIVWGQLMQVQSDPVWPTATVAVGNSWLGDTLQLRRPGSDEFVARGDAVRRSDITVLPPLTLDNADDLMAYTDHYCEMLGVKNRISENEAVGFRLVNASRRAIGTALSMAQWAVALASLRGKAAALHTEDFAHVAEIRLGCLPENNPFLVEDWEQIDFQKIAPRSFDEARYKSDDDEAA